MTPTQAKTLSLKDRPRIDDLGAFRRWTFPVIRSIQEGPLINELVSVQPMPLPTAEVFYKDFCRQRRRRIQT